MKTIPLLPDVASFIAKMQLLRIGELEVASDQSLEVIKPSTGEQIAQVARSNNTIYGLAAGLWSQDFTRVRRMADALHAGTIWVNCWGETDAASPFGGVKQSGYGQSD
jgi:acyl-CoA reductase-like NAD-dependent aldehyde dehydrogenase